MSRITFNVRAVGAQKLPEITNSAPIMGTPRHGPSTVRVLVAKPDPLKAVWSHPWVVVGIAALFGLGCGVLSVFAG